MLLLLLLLPIVEKSRVIKSHKNGMKKKKMLENAEKLFNTFAALRFNLSPHELPKNIQTWGIYTHTDVYINIYVFCILWLTKEAIFSSHCAKDQNTEKFLAMTIVAS